MNAKLSIVVPACLALFLSACGSVPQNLILGKWEAASATVAGADAGPEVGSALNAIKGTYKFDGNELEWTVNGITTKSKANVSATELDVTDGANRTIKYKRR